MLLKSHTHRCSPCAVSSRGSGKCRHESSSAASESQGARALPTHCSHCLALLDTVGRRLFKPASFALRHLATRTAGSTTPFGGLLAHFRAALSDIPLYGHASSGVHSLPRDASGASGFGSCGESCYGWSCAGSVWTRVFQRPHPAPLGSWSSRTPHGRTLARPAGPP